MPTYDYQCQACGHTFEEFQMMSAKPLKKCPSCGKLKLKRLIGTGAGIIFKGSGFYETDYRSDSYKNAAKNDKPSDKKSESKSDSKKSETKKSESKPAAKKESKPAKKTDAA